MDGVIERNQRAAVIASGVPDSAAAAALFTFNQLGCTTRHLG